MIECACSCDWIDYDPATVFDQRWIKKSRVEHTCCECGDVIPVGMPYQRSWGVWDGDQHTFNTCIPCSRIRDDLCPHAAFGELASEIEGCIGFNYVAGINDEDDS